MVTVDLSGIKKSVFCFRIYQGSMHLIFDACRFTFWTEKKGYCRYMDDKMHGAFNQMIEVENVWAEAIFLKKCNRKGEKYKDNTKNKLKMHEASKAIKSISESPQ